MPGPVMRRRLAAAERAAIAASGDDPSFDPADVIAAAGEQMERALGRRQATGLAHAERLFGAINTTFPGWAAEVPPEKVNVIVGRPRLWIASLERDERQRVTAVTVRAEAQARLWIGRIGFLPARIVYIVIGAELARYEQLSAYWVFERDPLGWRLDRLADAWWVEHELRTDPSGESARVTRMTDATVVELAEEPAEGPNVPYEIATNLPRDPRAAIAELALIDDRFAPVVIDAAVRRLHDRRDPEHGPRVKSVEVTRVRALRTPPEIEVAVRARGPGGWGSRREAREWWRLAATGSREEPWRLVDDEVEPEYRG
jgi:hypothetical protein